MKNLQLITCDEFNKCTLLSSCLLMSINEETGILYGATLDTVFAFESREDINVIAEVSLKNEGCLDVNATIISIQYVVDQFCLSIATSSGELILWNHESISPLESVGVVGDGIEAMHWSNDFELLVLITGKKNVILMSRDFEVVSESPLLCANFGEAELVSIGWGKKETQFHGSEGKAAAKKKSEGPTQLLDWDDRKSRITWRGDNQYFAAHYVDPVSNSRVFKIWTREGKLHATSIQTKGLAQAISFKTQGNLLASSVFQQNEHKVAFFEKNGLQHGEFVLPISGENAKVRELSWNMDSTILAIFCELDNSTTQVQLWTTSNYHWYMKQCLEFSGDEKVSCFTWDQECPMKLHLFTSLGRYFRYNWVFAIHKSLEISHENDINVGVIDGDHLCITPFARCVVPPPMSAYQVKASSFIRSIMFGHGDRVNDFLALSIDGHLRWYAHHLPSLECQSMRCSTSGFTDVLLKTKTEEEAAKESSILPVAMGGNGFKVMCDLPQKRAQARFPVDGRTQLELHHFTWVGEEYLVACSSFIRNSQSIKVFQVSWDEGTISVKGVVQVPTGKKVLATDFNSVLKIILMQLDDGSCYKFDPYDIELSPWPKEMDGHFAFPRPCTRVSLIYYDNKEILIGLTEQFRFFLNENELAQDCTSYDVHKNFILLTTHSHVLRSVCLKGFIMNDTSLPTGESTRALERGSKLVCLVPRDTKVVLQMPRGNLEVIHPRSLLLEAIQNNIEKTNFKEAFELCRRHRVNMNILVDHDISFFKQQISTVVEQLASAHNINILLSDIQEEDYTKSMYSSYFKDRQNVQQPYAGSKVDTVCEVFLDAMRLKDEQKFFHSILMTFLKRSPPNIEGALVELKRMKDWLQDNLQFTEDALKFMTYMVDVNILYDVAMGTYDLKLVLMVAEKSQKDPKEYLPYLNELRKMSPDLMKYRIDLKLKRFSRALVHITRLGKDHFDECKKLVVDQKLYAEALDLFVADSPEYKEIAIAYAQHLASQKKYEEAGMLYFKAKEFHLALGMFEESKNWRFAMMCVSSLQFSDVETVTFARKLAGILIESHLYLEAARVLENYAMDYEEAIMSLISGHHWDEALIIIYKHKRMDLLEVSLKPSLMSNAEEFGELIDRTRVEFAMHKDRLAEVRRVKEALSDIIRDGAEAKENCDLYSDTSSINDGESIASSSVTTDSRSSRKTGKSSKSRQKLARKKWSLRKGGPTEEFALIEVLYKIITMVNNWRAEMSVLLKTLVLFNNEKTAGILQNKFENILALLDESIPLIWIPNNPGANNISDQVYGPHMSSNAIVQLRNKQNEESPMPSDPILFTPPLFDKKDSAWKLSMLYMS